MEVSNPYSRQLINTKKFQHTDMDCTMKCAINSSTSTQQIKNYTKTYHNLSLQNKIPANCCWHIVKLRNSVASLKKYSLKHAPYLTNQYSLGRLIEWTA